MKLITLSSIGFALFMAMGAVAVPTNPGSHVVDTHAEGVDAGIHITYYGTCTQKTGQCKYKGQTGMTTICKCPDGCSKDGQSCRFDSVTKLCFCF
ncbi:antifungal protein [Trichoderma sp. SZMC 28012]